MKSAALLSALVLLALSCPVPADEPGPHYDGDDNFATWDAAARGVPGGKGFMYTTWQNRYDDLERYGRLLSRKK